MGNNVKKVESTKGLFVFFEKSHSPCRKKKHLEKQNMDQAKMEEEQQQEEKRKENKKQMKK